MELMIQKKNTHISVSVLVVAKGGIEPPTSGL